MCIEAAGPCQLSLHYLRFRRLCLRSVVSAFMPFGIVVALLPLSLVSHSYLQASPFETLQELIFCQLEWAVKESGGGSRAALAASLQPAVRGQWSES